MTCENEQAGLHCVNYSALLMTDCIYFYRIQFGGFLKQQDEFQINKTAIIYLFNPGVLG